MRVEDAELKDRIEEMKDKLQNPFFRAANEQLIKKYEREIKEHEAAEKIRKYLRDENPGASFAKVIMDTKVEMRIVEQLIADGRIDIRVTEKDMDILEAEKRKVIENLTKDLSKTEKILGFKSERDAKKREETAVKGSGLYSKKENLGKDKDPHKK